MLSLQQELNTIDGSIEDKVVNGLIAQRIASPNYKDLSGKKMTESAAIAQMIETPKNYIITVIRSKDAKNLDFNLFKKIADSIAVDNKALFTSLELVKEAQTLKPEELGKDLSAFSFPAINADENLEKSKVSQKIQKAIDFLKESGYGIELTYDSQKMLFTLKGDTVQLLDNPLNDIVEEGNLTKYYASFKTHLWPVTTMIQNLEEKYDTKGHSVLVVNPDNEEKVLFYRDKKGIQYDFSDEIIRKK